jgi:hypothetical protein
MLNARKHGAEVIGRATASDPTLRAYLAKQGQPDFVYVASPTDLELVYQSDSRLAHFHRETPDAPSTVSEVTPLPSPLLNVLPRDLRAGTPGAGVETGHVGQTSCWEAPAGGGICRTCCKTPRACSTDCRN